MSVSRRWCAVLAIAAAAGCTTTVTGQHEPGHAARRAADLNALLLTPDEIDTAMNATDMTVDTTKSTLVDDSPNTKPVDCLAVSSMGQEHIYAGTNWEAARMQSLHEPGDDYSHLAHQAVIQFPTAADAAAFYTASARTWQACAPGRYNYSAGAGQADTAWEVGPVSDQNRILATSNTQREGDGWTCQRALTAAVNIVADVLTCSYLATDRAASTIARQIAHRVTGQ